MKCLYWFEDVDGIECEVERDLEELFSYARLLRVLCERFSADPDCSFLLDHILISVDTMSDLLNGLCLGLHYKFVSDDQFALIRAI